MSEVAAPLSNDRGFTLLEMLVTLAVLSAISTVMLGAIVSLRQVTRQLLFHSSENAQVAVAQTMLRSRVEGLRALPRAGRVSGVVDLEGDDQRLSFYAPPLDRNAPNSLQAYRLLRMATGDLVLFSASALTEDVDLRARSPAGWDRTKLLDGVDELSISYFGPSADAPGGRWQRFWSDRAQPPQLIRVGLRFPEGDRRSWPELIIHPTVTMNMACKFDAITSRCSEAGVQ
jgi:general secretion pathway protein J